MKTFNTTGQCIPKKHYMVCIDDKLAEIKKMVDEGNYFAINRARQYGKTTTLRILAEYLKKDYVVISFDFQKMSAAQFKDEGAFVVSFSERLLKVVNNRRNKIVGLSEESLSAIKEALEARRLENLGQLFDYLSELCDTAEKPVVLMVDEVDSATNNQVFLDFLAQLRAYYIDREAVPTFQSVILAGVYGIKNLKLKIRPDSDHKFNSPKLSQRLYFWNIAKAFKVDMSFSAEGISGMLRDYESDHHTGMDVNGIAQSIFEYTSGYPFLASYICQTIEENISINCRRLNGNTAWSVGGVKEAVGIILKEQATIFESMIKQIDAYKELKDMLHAILFQGSTLAYNPDSITSSLGLMFGFIKDNGGNIAVANRIFEMRLYNYFLSEVQLTNASYHEAQKNRNQFIRNGMLDMDSVIRKFVVHFHDVYGDNDKKFVEEYGRKFFLMYLKPIINGTGNYYIESETRDAKRTDVIVDYLGKQFIIELKIWNGEKYNTKGEAQVAGYLERYHLDKGYLLSFSFNKNKKIGVKTIEYGGKSILEAIV